MSLSHQKWKEKRTLDMNVESTELKEVSVKLQNVSTSGEYLRK